MKRQAPAAAFAVTALAIGIFSAMDAVMKGLTLAIGAYQAMLWRSLAGIVLSGVLYAARRSPWPAAATMRIHLIRAGVSTAMALLFFWGLARVPLAQGVALTFIAPLIALFLAAVLLKERVGKEAILASAVAFAGVLTIVAGQARSALGPQALAGAVAIIVSAVCYAFNIILMRRQALLAGPIETAFFQNLFVAVALGLAAPFAASPPPLEQAPMIVLAAGFATLSLLLFAWAYARAEASYLAPAEYTAFLWAAGFGFLVFGETVSPWTLAGAVLILGGCALAARRGTARVPDLEAAI